MSRSLIKLRIYTGHSLFIEVRVKLKNTRVPAPKVFISFECQADCSLQPEDADLEKRNFTFCFRNAEDFTA